MNGEERLKQLVFLNPLEGVKIQVPAQLSKELLRAVVTKVNLKALEWLEDKAIDILDQGIEAHGRPQTWNRLRLGKDKATTSLQETIKMFSSHEVSATNIVFMIDERVRRTAPHYYVQDVGYRGFVGRIFNTRTGGAPIGFFEGDQRLKASGNRYHRDATKRGRFSVRIVNPIKGYHYITGAVTAFKDQDVYWGLIKPALEDLEKALPGVKIVLTRAQA